MAKKKKKEKRGRKRRSGESRATTVRTWISANRELLKAYIIFIAFITITFSILITPWGKEQLAQPLNRFIAVVSTSILNLLGTAASASANNIMSGEASVKIKEGCNGVYATMIFLAGIVAYPTSLRKKLIGVVLGTIALFIVNLVRVLSLFYLSAFFPELFDEAHLYIWQFAIIIIGGLFWLVWYDKIVSPPAVEKSV
jgi:exosortase H (IPTLxxWG-CTERM-specific)